MKCRLVLTDDRWHCLTAVGGYIAVAIVDLITSDEPIKDPIDSMAWPVPMGTRLVSRSFLKVKEA